MSSHILILIFMKIYPPNHVIHNQVNGFEIEPMRLKQLFSYGLTVMKQLFTTRLEFFIES